jgi:hypothetical protein
MHTTCCTVQRGACLIINCIHCSTSSQQQLCHLCMAALCRHMQGALAAAVAS